METSNALDLQIQRKSLLIVQAQFQQALAQKEEATRLYLEAALLEEKIAAHFQQERNFDDAAISLFSAASCYKKAGALAKALALAKEAVAQSGSAEFVTEIQSFIEANEALSNSAPRRSLRGIVRNGAIHPFESGVLVEGELVTINAA